MWMRLYKWIVNIYLKIEEFIIGIAVKLFKIIHIHFDEMAHEELVRVFRFLVLGFVSMAISYGIYVLVILLGGNYFSGSVLAFLFGVGNNFVWNNGKIFTATKGKKYKTTKGFIKAFASYFFTGFIIQVGLLHLWVDVLKISDLIAPIINIIFIVPLNYMLNRFWVFK